MSIQKQLLQNAMQSTRVLKSDETSFLDIPDEKSIKDLNKSNLTFRKNSKFVAEQIHDKIIYENIMMLSNCEKKIIMYLCGKKEKQDNLLLTTKIINLSIIAKEIEIHISTIKKSIQRLEKKGYLNRLISKSGRNGWTIYSIPSSIVKLLF